MSVVTYTLGDLSKQIAVREKSIKIMQYYGTFLSGYYADLGPQSAEVQGALKMVGTLQSGRKAIRFLRSVQHFTTSIDLLKDLQGMDWNTVKKSFLMKIAEELCMAFYFLGDNHFLLAQAGVLQKSPFFEQMLYYGDFMADVTGVAHSVLTLQELKEEKEELTAHLEQVRQDPAAAAQAEAADIEASLAIIEEERLKACVHMVVAALQMVNSGNYPGVELWRRIFGAPCPATWVGLSGVLSSSVVIWNAWPKAQSAKARGALEAGNGSPSPSSSESSHETTSEEAKSDNEEVKTK